MLLIRHATILTPEHRLEDGAVLVDGDRIVAVEPTDQLTAPAQATRLDADGLILVPGFIDLQCNGGFGLDFTTDPNTIWSVASQLPRYGITAFLPTIITSPLEQVTRSQAVVQQPPQGLVGSTPLGLHVEGPFLNPQKRGAHNPAYLRAPDLKAADGWSPEAGVRLVTLAPELPGALDLAAALAERGTLVSAGHSTATYAQALAGFDAGIRYGTHLFNAMPPLHHREPGLAGALLTDPRPAVGFIADGIHTHQSVVNLAWQSLGRRLNLVTDAMAALGMAPGRHPLGDFEVIVDDTSARLADGTLAGSILSLDQALRNLVAWTACSLSDALVTVTTTPARALGMEDQRGRVAPGYGADLVLLTRDLQVYMTFVAGQPVYAVDDTSRLISF